MALLDRFLVRGDPAGPPPEPRPLARSLRVLRADGQRWDLTRRDAGNRIAATRQTWQADAWDYRDMIGELRYAQRLLARSVARVRFYAAENRPYPDDPAELTGKDHHLDAQLAADAVANLARLPLEDGPDGFVATMTENIETAGEAWIHGQPQGRSEETWTVRSISEITSAGDQIFLSELPNSALAGQRPLTPDEELLRCWIRHPRWGQLADSPLRAMLDVLEDVVLAGREMRAASRSRISANGVLLIPDELSLMRTREEDEDPAHTPAALDDDFLADFTRDMVTPIRNEGDAGAVVPILLRGPGERLKEVQHIRLDRDDAVKLMERLNGAVLRMLKGLDIQPEQVEGMGQVNHWTGWIIQASDVKQQVEPTADIIAAILTKAFLRPALLALGHPPDQVRRVIVDADVSDLVENPNRGQDARDAHAALAISDEALRRELGFDDDDAPEDEEVQRRIAARAGIDPSTSAVVLELGKALREAQSTRQPVAVNGGDRDVKGLPAGQDGARGAQPGERTPEQVTPAEPTQVTAAADPDPLEGWTIDMAAVRELAAIDAAVVDRIVTAADAAIVRVLERAGGRARNAVRKDQSLSASIDGVDAVRVPGVLGRDALLAHASVPDLLAETYDRLRTQTRRWLSEASSRAIDVALRMLRLQRSSARGRELARRLEAELEARRTAAVDAVIDAVQRSAEDALFRADPLAAVPGQRGEDFDTLVAPGEVMDAVSLAGGTGSGDPRAGLGTGPIVTDAVAEQGGLVLGYEWAYHPERPRATFTPHARLDGTRFTAFTDPKLDTDTASGWVGAYFQPGDHAGCRCSALPIVAIPEPGADLSRLTAPAPGTMDARTAEVRDRLARAVIGGDAA